MRTEKGALEHIQVNCLVFNGRGDLAQPKINQHLDIIRWYYVRTKKRAYKRFVALSNDHIGRCQIAVDDIQVVHFGEYISKL